MLTQARLVAQGNNALPDRLGIQIGVERFNFFVAWHDADAGQDPKHVSLGLMRDVQTSAERFFKGLKWELNLGGMLKLAEREANQDSLSDLVAEFCAEATKANEFFKSEGKDGLLFFVDELDRVRPDAGIATFFKLATERLSRENQKNIGFFCAGITGAIQRLEDDHGSIGRVFRDIPIPRFDENETTAIIVSGFKKVGCGYHRTIPMRVIELSAGFPEPVHLLGSEMLSVDSDDYIDHADFDKSKEKIISDVKKNKLDNLLRAAGGGKYQKILLGMANYSGPNVPLKFLCEDLGWEQNQFSTNMSTLVEREVITRLDKGIYGFTDPLLKEYIRKFGIIDVDPNQTSLEFGDSSDNPSGDDELGSPSGGDATPAGAQG